MRLKRTAWAAVVALGTVAAAGPQATAHSPGMGQGQGMMGGGTGQGMMMNPAMQRMMMQRMTMMHGMMHGMMGSRMGPSVIYGMGPGAGKDLTVDDVKTYLERVLQRHGNKRLKLGKVTQSDKDTIVAEIVTVDDSLVQKLSIDRHDRTVKQVD